jgi:hypothetical protein
MFFLLVVHLFLNIHIQGDSDYYDHKILFKLKNSELFYERVIYLAGIKTLNHLVLLFIICHELLFKTHHTEI